MLRPRLAGFILALSVALSAAFVSGTTATPSSPFDLVGFCYTHYQDYLSSSGTPVLETSTVTVTDPVFFGTFTTSTAPTSTFTFTTTVVPTPYTPPAECFTGCIIDVDAVKLMYWPTPKPSATQTGAPVEITSLPALPSSVVVDGSTLVSPSNYVIFTNLVALKCPFGDSPCTTIGKPVPLTTLAFSQNELLSEECFLNFRTINYADFQSPVPWSIVSNQPGCTTLGREPPHDPALPATGYTLNPVLQLSDEVRTAVDPLWASCSFINAAFHPPIPLGPTALTTVLPPAPTPSTSQEASPTSTPSEPASPTPSSAAASSDPPPASSSPVSPNPPAQSSSVVPPDPPTQSSSVVPPNPPAQSSSVLPPNPPAQSSSSPVPPNSPAASSSVILSTPPAQSSSPAAPSNPPAESSPAAPNPPPGGSVPVGEVSSATPPQPTEVINNENPAPVTSNGVSESSDNGGNQGATPAPSGDLGSGSGSGKFIELNDLNVTQGSGLASGAPAASSVTMSLITIVTTSDAVAGSGSETVGGQDSTGFVTGATSPANRTETRPANRTETAAPTVVRSEASAIMRGLTICKGMAIAMLFAVWM